MDPLVVSLALAAAGGALIGLLLSVFGGGGSVLATPLLLYLVGIRDPHVAIGVSAAGVGLNALTALAGQARAGRVLWPVALLFAAVGAVGALAGSSIAKAINGQVLLLFFAFAMAAVAVAMLRPRPQADAVDARLTRANAPKVAAAGTGVGIAAGFFGIGGGFLIVPGLMAATGMTLALAQASSLVSVAAFGATTALNYATSGLINWPIVGAMAVGGAVGTLAGLPIAHRLGANAALGRSLFAGLILIVSVYVAFKAIAAL